MAFILAGYVTTVLNICSLFFDKPVIYDEPESQPYSIYRDNTIHGIGESNELIYKAIVESR